LVIDRRGAGGGGAGRAVGVGVDLDGLTGGALDPQVAVGVVAIIPGTVAGQAIAQPGLRGVAGAIEVGGVLVSMGRRASGTGKLIEFVK